MTGILELEESLRQQLNETQSIAKRQQLLKELWKLSECREALSEKCSRVKQHEPEMSAT